MAEYPYSMSVDRMQEFINKIPSMGRPDKVTLKTLEVQGFKSTNDRTIIPTLKFLGIIDESGSPTESWQALCDRESFRKVIAALVRHSYADVFTSFPRAQSVAERDIRNHMAAHSKGQERVVAAMVGVFKMLCSLGDFEGEPVSLDEIAASHPETDQVSRGTQRLSPPSEPQSAPVSMQFNLTIAESASLEQIEATFKYAAKYLLGREVN